MTQNFHEQTKQLNLLPFLIMIFLNKSINPKRNLLLPSLFFFLTFCYNLFGFSAETFISEKKSKYLEKPVCTQTPPTVPEDQPRKFTRPDQTLCFLSAIKMCCKNLLFVLSFTPKKPFYLTSGEVCTTSFVGYANQARRGCKHPSSNRPGGPTTNVFQPR